MLLCCPVRCSCAMPAIPGWPLVCSAVPGLGHLIHTYKGDGDPIPSFEGEPVPVEMDGDLDSFTQMIWNSLNEDNKVSLFTRFIDLESGKAESRIINKNK